MKLIKVGAACLNQTPLDWDNNYNNICTALDLAAKNNVDFLCLPELCITGYGVEDYFHSQFVIDKAQVKLKQIALYGKKYPNLVFSVGLPIIYNNCIYNANALCFDGKILGIVCKHNLANDGVHYESRFFKAWDRNCIVSNFNRYFCPIGDMTFSFNGIKVGFEICEEGWVDNRIGAILSNENVDIILNPSASHFALGKNETRKHIIIEGSRAYNCAYVYANLLGNESGRIIYDGSCFIATEGKIVAEGNRFSFNNVKLISRVIDIDKNRLNRISSYSYKPTNNLYNVCTCKIFPKSYKDSMVFSKPSLEVDNKYVEFEKALSLGLFDYLRKSKAKGYVVSLSGGADSSLCALLCLEMKTKAINDIDLNGFNQKLNLNEDYNDLSFLTCVYQASKNSSKETLEAAESLAKAINCKFYNIDVSNIISEYTNTISDIVGKTLTWESNDIVLQNIQARVRSPSAWMLANLENKILICTTNRSESAVGYGTIGGDLEGGIAPIAGIDKAFILDYLKWALEKYKKENNLSIVNALNKILKQRPTAELRPKELNQTDEKDLMPYIVLNKIEKAAIRDKKSPQEVVNTLILDNENIYNRDDIIKWVKKFYTLWCRNQWKRERLVLSFHIDDENLDPRSWCRFPVLNGEFKDELNNLI